MIDAAGLSACINAAVEEYVARHSDTSLTDGLAKPVLRIEAFLDDGVSNGSTTPSSRLIASTTLELHEKTGRSPRANGSSTNRSSLEAPSLASILIDRNSNGAARGHSALHSSTPVESPPELVRRSDSPGDSDDSPSSPRKATGGLRLATSRNSPVEDEDSQRQLQVDGRNFPKRRKLQTEGHLMQPSSLDKLIIGIWEQLYGTISLDPPAILDQVHTDNPTVSQDIVLNRAQTIGGLATISENSFSRMSVFCRKVTQASRACRSVELMVQAIWIEHFDARIEALATQNPGMSVSKHRKRCMKDACQDFMWSEKELRNRMSIWRGYKEVKDAAGWAALVFSGMGLYRFCKYRVGFDREAMQRLRSLKHRFEVAADTMHPHWRQLLPLVGEPSEAVYTGHPHDWVISENGIAPLPLRSTYLQWDPYFSFEHIDESIIDTNAFGSDDPRWLALSHTPVGNPVCEACSEKQSDDPKENSCQCFPDLFGCVAKKTCAVQVFRTSNGRNNGLLVCCPFERGASIGEFTGLLTKSLSNTDVMTITPRDSNTTVQISQKRYGNHTRFVNHSCNPNAQFQQFIWMNTQRVILVSKGIAAGEEILVDYSDRYWDGLDKTCLCGEPCCRYKRAVRAS